MARRMAVNDSERTLVERARQIEKLKARKEKLEATLAETDRALDEARQTLVNGIENERRELEFSAAK